MQHYLHLLQINVVEALDILPLADFQNFITECSIYFCFKFTISRQFLCRNFDYMFLSIAVIKTNVNNFHCSCKEVIDLRRVLFNQKMSVHRFDHKQIIKDTVHKHRAVQSFYSWFQHNGASAHSAAYLSTRMVDWHTYYRILDSEIIRFCLGTHKKSGVLSKFWKWRTIRNTSYGII